MGHTADTISSVVTMQRNQPEWSGPRAIMGKSDAAVIPESVGTTIYAKQWPSVRPVKGYTVDERERLVWLQVTELLCVQSGEFRRNLINWLVEHEIMRARSVVVRAKDAIRVDRAREVMGLVVSRYLELDEKRRSLAVNLLDLEKVVAARL